MGTWTEIKEREAKKSGRSITEKIRKLMEEVEEILEDAEEMEEIYEESDYEETRRRNRRHY